MLSLLVCLLLESKVCWLIWCPSHDLIKVIAGLYCFENVLLLVVLLFVIKICYLYLSAVFCWLFPRILLACVFVSYIFADNCYCCLLAVLLAPVFAF